MRFSWKRSLLAILPMLVIGTAGCGGFRTSQSVSPATFLLPGVPKLLQTAPPVPADGAIPGQLKVSQVASVQ
ncbi:MAG: hypothetical protein EBS05_00845 [Proteobacteria bacterium]|nr:hypothetical protein [Pseudomonadota bacterium]